MLISFVPHVVILPSWNDVGTTVTAAFCNCGGITVVVLFAVFALDAASVASM
jgi:hypothetical protein